MLLIVNLEARAEESGAVLSFHQKERGDSDTKFLFAVSERGAQDLTQLTFFFFF